MSRFEARIRYFSGTRLEDIQDPKTIIAECKAAYKTAFEADPSGAAVFNLRGIPLANRSAFVKFGSNLELREAEMQDFVYRTLSTDNQTLSANDRIRVRVPRIYAFIVTTQFRYIVMELIDGSMCNETHVPQVARALQRLIAIKAPSTAPGPVRPGPIDHCLFKDNNSSATFPSVLNLQTHFNAILATHGHTDTLDLVGEVERYGLCLCPSDMDKSNFMIDPNGVIVAIDFGQTSFLPPSFFHFAITVNKPFINLLARAVECQKYPTAEKNHLDALQYVGYILTISSSS